MPGRPAGTVLCWSRAFTAPMRYSRAINLGIDRRGRGPPFPDIFSVRTYCVSAVPIPPYRMLAEYDFDGLNIQ